MLEYKIISDVNRARRRIKASRYAGRQWTENQTRSSDELFVFTFTTQALQHSRANLDLCFEVAKGLEMSTVVLRTNAIQLAGDTGSGRHELASKSLFPDEWLVEHGQWLDTSYVPQPMLQDTPRGENVEMYGYRDCFCLNEHQGVYDVATGRRLTNRREIITRFWDLGFASQRGRPLSMARLRWTGEREELELLTKLANQHWENRHKTTAAKKLVSAFTSINRYAAWPGAW